MRDAQPVPAGMKPVDANDAPRDKRRTFDKRHYDAQALSAKLQSQGMIVDLATALPYLRQVGGYRLKGYWYQWQDPGTKKFRKGTHFNDVIDRYEFDRELRRITGTVLERIELMVRAVISNELSEREGPHWFMQESVFKLGPRNADPAKISFLQKVQTEVKRMKDKPFVAHYLDKYYEPSLPPSWAMSECLSFGTWSHAYFNLANPNYRKAISQRFGVPDARVFAQWLHVFSVLLNTVAHHGRLLGAQTSITPADYKGRGLIFNKERTFFVTASVINYICKRISRGPRWHSELKALFAAYPAIPVEGALGFPPDWEQKPGWIDQPAPAAKPAKPKKASAHKPKTTMEFALQAALNQSKMS